MQKGKYTTPEQIEEMRRELQREKQKISGAPTVEGDKERKLRKKKLAAKAAGWAVFISVVLLLVTAIASIYMAKSRGEVPSLLGFQLFVVESGSMEPTLDIGSVILCRKPKNAAELRENNIVTFKTLSGFIVTHRIVQVNTDGSGRVTYRTKGDNPHNSIDQEVLTPDRVLAVFIAKIPLT